MPTPAEELAEEEEEAVEEADAVPTETPVNAVGVPPSVTPSGSFHFMQASEIETEGPEDAEWQQVEHSPKEPVHVNADGSAEVRTIYHNGLSLTNEMCLLSRRFLQRLIGPQMTKTAFHRYPVSTLNLGRRVQ